MTLAATPDLTRSMLHLRQVPVGAMLSPSVLRVLAGHLVARTFEPGEVVVRRGEPVDALHLLTDGALDLVRDGKKIGAVVAPQTLGFLGILARQDSPYDAVAAGEVSALELETDTLLEAMDDHFELLATTLKYLAERLYFEFQELPEKALGIPPMELGKAKPGAIDLVDRVLFMRKMSGFATANVSALAGMARQMEETRIPAGTKLWSAGERAERVVFVVEGNVACKTPDGRAFRYGAGTGVGGIEVLAERPRWYDAVVETPLLGLMGQPEDMLDLFEHQTRMAMDFLAMLARAQIGIIERKASVGVDPLAALRDVSKLGAVRVGA